MASDSVREVGEIFTRFLRDTCCADNLFDREIIHTVCDSTGLAGQRHPEDLCTIPLIAGTCSLAELYIRQILSCVGDRDIMYHRSTELAIPRDSLPPTQLPPEFASRVIVYEIIDRRDVG